MATVPSILLAMQSVEKAVFFGDPQQLPPVGKTQNYKRSIFDILNISDSFREGVVHNKCVFLDTQFRCHPEIAKLVSKVFYGDLLKNGRVLQEDKKAIFINNTNKYCGIMNGANGSYVNVAHQQVVIKQVENALKRGQTSIGVITPFKAQADAINKLYDTKLRESYPDVDFKAATIHSFQGQEKDVVIFDMVVGKSSKKDLIPRMLKGDKASDAANLLNVATTRARDFFVLVCDLETTYESLGEDGEIPG